MSTYLVALAVGDFVCTEGKTGTVPVRVCSTPDKKALTGFALEATQKVIEYFDTYYAIKYPFKKLDVVAVPDFAAGATENTAAIFYREEYLLADPSSASVGTRELIASVRGHEIAHQWFGNLVTMAWWDDVWLDEGFAMWAANKPVRRSARSNSIVFLNGSRRNRRYQFDAIMWLDSEKAVWGSVQCDLSPSSGG